MIVIENGGFMINNWEEIAIRFNSIKESTLATDYLVNELAVVLESAYKLNPITANEMWNELFGSYIYNSDIITEDLCIKLLNGMSNELCAYDVAKFFCMDEERVDILFETGYLEEMLKSYVNRFSNLFLKNGDEENFYMMLDKYYDKYRNKDKAMIAFIRGLLENAMHYTKDDKGIEINKILKYLKKYENINFNAYITVFEVVYGLVEDYDIERIFSISKRHCFNEEYFELLWIVRNSYNKDELRFRWYDYLCDIKEYRDIPYKKSYDDIALYSDNEKLIYYADLIYLSDPILRFYFGNEGYDVLKYHIVNLWVKEGRWGYFNYYVTSEINMLSYGDKFKNTLIYSYLKHYVTRIDLLEVTDPILRNSYLFVKILKNIALNTVNGVFLELVEPLVKIDNEFCEPIYEEKYNSVLLQTNIANVKKKIYLYNKELNNGCINKEIYNNIDNLLWQLFKMTKQNEESKLDIFYELAVNSEVIEFMIKNIENNRYFVKNIISACLKKENINRVEYLLKLLGSRIIDDKSKKYCLEVIFDLIDEYSYYEKNKSDYDLKNNISDEMRINLETALGLSLECFSPEIQVELIDKAKLINRKSSIYIQQLLEDVEMFIEKYSENSKDKLYLENMIEGIIESFKKLSYIKRVDVIVDIMTKLTVLSECFYEFNYNKVFMGMIRNIKKEEARYIYNKNRAIFRHFFDKEKLSDNTIFEVTIAVLEGMEKEEFITYCEMLEELQGERNEIAAIIRYVDDELDSWDKLYFSDIKKHII